MADISHKFRVAVVGFTPLIDLALRELISEISDKYEVFCVRAFDQIPEGADFYIVTSGIFLSHISYFLPRKQHLAVLIDNNSTRSDYVSDELLVICSDDSVEAIKSQLANALSSIVAETPIYGELTPREKDVLCLLASGNTVKEIAANLGISVNTALTHRKNISSKLGIRSVSGLSLYAMMNGLL